MYSALVRVFTHLNQTFFDVYIENKTYQGFDFAQPDNF
jgi:hypothetical protein